LNDEVVPSLRSRRCSAIEVNLASAAVAWSSEGLQREFRDATCGTIQAKDESMRAETQNLVEEIKQSVRLLRRHL
jgi:hypothetical protein